MKTLDGECSGTVAEFVAYRADRIGTNREQLEAFFQELYLLLVRLINEPKNKFKICSIMNFPKPKNFDILHLCIWSILYQEWLSRLYASEKKTMARLEVTWQ